MAYKISNPDFFKTHLKEEDGVSVTSDSLKESDSGPGEKAQPLKVGAAVESVLVEAGKLLKESGFPEMATETEKIRQNAKRERFTVAVVGEFSKGKSTFINKFLDREVLPTGNLPTTAIMTRIRYNPREVIIGLDERNRKVCERKLSLEAWDGLVAHNFGGEDFRGMALAGINSDWLRDSNIELIDTPGAGDLSESRVKVVGDALLGCDGVIITISATAALSLSEKLFIEERLLVRKIPFILLVVTKLDLVPVKERIGIIRYIKNKIENWKMDIPVYVPYSVELDDTAYDHIVGMDKVKRKILQWAAHPQRVRLVETWMLGKTEDLLQNAISALNEKKVLLDESDKEKREALVSDKKQKLAQAQLVWGDLKLQMQRKCTECYQLLLTKVDEYSESITERLQYEVSHTGSPQKWWNEDFPYRIKMELTNMAERIENTISRQMGEDAHWYCVSIEKTFQSYVLYQKQTVSDKEIFGNFDIGREIKFEDLDKQRTAFRVGSAVLSISGFALFSVLGFMPIVATIGVGTGTSIISEKFFQKKIEAQKEELKREIARCVPFTIQESMKESEKRLESVYNNIMNEADKSERTWLDVQKAAIEGINIPDEGRQAALLGDRIEKIQKQINRVHTIQ